jgi:ParB/RepB/Spo0J family partition protein
MKDSTKSIASAVTSNTMIVNDWEREIPQRIPIDKIIVDPNQPRKTFNPQKDEELFQSVVSYGIFQTLLLRPKGDLFMIVSGERRYKAGLRANLPDVPAILRNLTDQQALIIQHLENAQREEVNLMERAKSFKLILNYPNASMHEIAAKTGLSIFYIRQLLKLNDLIPKWQHMVYLSALHERLALQIAQLPEEAQTTLYKNAVTEEQENSSTPIVNINIDQIKRYQGFLSTAKFDITDSQLLPNAGACTNCPFNSATACLFPSEEAKPRCNKISCFQEKFELHLQFQIEQVKLDPSLVFVYQGYGNSDKADNLKAAGNEVLKIGHSSDCHIVTFPDEPNQDAYLTAAKKNKIPKKEALVEFKKRLQDYEDKKDFVEKMIQKGTYKKALMVDDQSGNKTGSYVFIEMIKKEQKSGRKIDVNKEDVSAEDIQNEINRITQNYNRSLELDQVHIHEAIITEYKNHSQKQGVPKSTLPIDIPILNFLLLEMLSYSNREEVARGLKVPTLWQDKNLPAFFKAISLLTKQQVSFVIRKILEDKYSNNLPNTKAGYLYRQLAEQMKCFPIKDIEKNQAEKALKRTKNKNERVAALQSQKAELTQKIKVKRNTTKVNPPNGKVQPLHPKKKTA